ncbi:MAG: hypothetical protein WC236_15800 [Gallionellaceae bacterium]
MQFVSTPEAGVPKAGVTRLALVNVGACVRTNTPVPVVSVNAVASAAEFGASAASASATVNASYAVPAAFTRRNLLPFPVYPASFAIAAAIAANSARIAAEVPEGPER